MEVKYANMIGFKVTHNEVALEFGNFFPGQDDNRTKPDYRDFHTRIVLPPDMIDALKQGLQQVVDVREQARKAVQGQPTFSIDTSEVKRA
jgi:hypothetical protein